MDRKFAISEYPDAAAVIRQLDELIRKPIYTIKPDALKRYEEEYYGEKCKKSKEIIDRAVELIPGGVQHNLVLQPPLPAGFYQGRRGLLVRH